MEYLESIKIFLGPPPLEEIEKNHSEEPENNVEGSHEEKELLELQDEINPLMSKEKETQLKLVDINKVGVTLLSRYNLIAALNSTMSTLVGEC